MVEKQSLTEYAAAQGNPWAKSCTICRMEDAVRKEVEEGLRAGIYGTRIADWLEQEHQLAVSAYTVMRHRRRCLT